MSKHCWFSGLTLLGLALAIWIGYLVAERQEQRAKAYNAAREQYENSKRLIAPGVVTDGKSSRPDPKSYREEWRSEYDLEAQREMADWTFFMLIASTVSVVVTAIGVVYVARTLKATRDAVDEAKQGTAAALIAANTGIRANEIARDGAERQLRAYISVKGMGWSFVKDTAGNTIAFNLTIMCENCGQTPARRCRSAANLKDFDHSIIPENFSYPVTVPKGALLTESNNIGPGQTGHVAIGINMQLAERVMQKKAALLVYGWMEYDDIFENSPRRRTEVCGFVNIDPIFKNGLFTIHGPFNGMDENCHHQPNT